MGSANRAQPWGPQLHGYHGFLWYHKPSAMGDGHTSSRQTHVPFGSIPTRWQPRDASHALCRRNHPLRLGAQDNVGWYDRQDCRIVVFRTSCCWVIDLKHLLLVISCIEYIICFLVLQYLATWIGIGGLFCWYSCTFVTTRNFGNWMLWLPNQDRRLDWWEDKNTWKKCIVSPQRILASKTVKYEEPLPFRDTEHRNCCDWGDMEAVKLPVTKKIIGDEHGLRL